MLRYVDEFRDRASCQVLAFAVAAAVKQDSGITLMEVCGTHTMSIHRHGIKRLLPANIRLLSGPGCPVCVTPVSFIDRAVAIARIPGTVIATFGDMLRVPGSSSSLEKERATGADVRVVSSALEAVTLAQQHKKRQVVFLGVGFETTAPTVAASIIEAEKSGTENFLVLSAHKAIPPALRQLSCGKIEVDGFICPAHVSAIIGSEAYDFLPRDFHKACVITGFEPFDVLQGILMLVEQINSGVPSLQVQYDRVVRPEGNTIAKHLLDEVFELTDTEWRGMGMLPSSGCNIRKQYSHRDASLMIQAAPEPPREPKGCICGSIIQGIKDPPECKLFGTACTPASPLGACMVSGEGTCAAWFKYSGEQTKNDSSGSEVLHAASKIRVVS